MRINDIQNALIHLVGWRQSYNRSKLIDEALTQSESGLNFQGAHPLMTLENIRNIMPEDWNEEQYPLWEDSVQYYKNDIVRDSNSKLWKALVNTKGIEPSSSPYWEKFDIFSEYLEQMTREGIATMVQKFLMQKELNRETKTLLENRTLFDGAARKNNTIKPTNKLVGFEIINARAMGVTTKIRRIGLQMVGATGVVKMYLFHSSKGMPVATKELNYTESSGMFQWFDIDWCMPYISKNNDSGGSWYVCYAQKYMPNGMYALNATRDWSKNPCYTCLGYGIDRWKEITKYMQISPFCVDIPDDFQESPRMWDIADMAYTNTMNYGLNCEVSVECDLSDFIINQRAMFANVLQKQVAYDALRTMAMNPDVRVNRNQSNVAMNDILYELDGAPQGKKAGLGYELENAYKALSLDTRGIDRICLACNNHGVQYRTI